MKKTPRYFARPGRGEGLEVGEGVPTWIYILLKLSLLSEGMAVTEA